jgi:peptidoglycan/xylan/chitin deacetylase (PgdA/CDA1 family)
VPAGKTMLPLTILTYHSLDTSASAVSTSPRRFRDHVESLVDLGYRGTALGEAVAHREATGRWPERTVVLTFDDGYASFYEHAYPVLVRVGFTATVFVVTGHMGGLNDWAPTPHRLGSLRTISWPQAAALQASGMEIGAHTHTHRDLRRLSTAEVTHEIARSQHELETYLGKPAVSFAYPFGGVSTVARGVVEQHFHAACTTALKRATSEPRLTLPRVDAYYVRDRRSLQQLLTGRLDAYLTLRRWGRSLRGLLPG